MLNNLSPYTIQHYCVHTLTITVFNTTAQSQTATSRPVAQTRALQTSLCLTERRAVSSKATRQLPRAQIRSAWNDVAACPRAQRPRPVAAAHVAQPTTKQNRVTPYNQINQLHHIKSLATISIHNYKLRIYSVCVYQSMIWTYYQLN